MCNYRKMNKEKCIIDNWSLEQAGFLLDNTSDFRPLETFEFHNALGGLSNFINALLLYDSPGYLKNGFETHWNRFDWFSKNSSSFLTPLDPSISKIDWNSEASYSDKGINNYLINSEIFDSDLFISPERSSEILSVNEPRVNDNLINTLKIIDEKISERKDDSWYDSVKIGIENNFILPSLTHYVLSEALNYEDLLTVIMQLKSDGKISRVKNKINEITSSTKNSMKFQKDIERLISDSFGKISKNEKTLTLKISVMFLSLSKSIDLAFFNRKEHLVFLKDIIALRTENRTLSNDIKRIFNRTL